MTTYLVDLDGTITDPAVGIIGSFQHALTVLGIEPPAHAELRYIIGPPLRQVFPTYLRPGQDVEHAVHLYRERYGQGGLFEATLYDGIVPALEQLAERDRLLVCTAKAQVFAARIITHFGLSGLFAGIYGPELSGRYDDKGELIGHMIEVEGLDPADAVMIGDRASDVRAAARHGIPTIGAAWGYGAPGELAEAGAAVICKNPAELPVAAARVIGERSMDSPAAAR